MTNKNTTVKPVRIRIDQQKTDSTSLTTYPDLYELVTLGDGTIIVKQVNGPNEGLLVTRDGTPIQSARL